MNHKKRLDVFLLERYPAYSRQHVQSLIMQGKVLVDGAVITKAGTMVDNTNIVEMIGESQPPFVSRAGFKLDHALKAFHIDVTDKIILDAGISTGGFTDCLLQRGARKVYGVDVGYGQVHEKVRNDPRVVILERTNLRYLTDIGELVDMVTLDLSFISILKVIDAVTALLKPGGILLVLIKPQFEAGRDLVGRGGIIKDASVHRDVVKRVTNDIQAKGYILQEVTESPIEGMKGNKEFLAWFIKKPT